jgi:hypothetical protein
MFRALGSAVNLPYFSPILPVSLSVTDYHASVRDMSERFRTYTPTAPIGLITEHVLSLKFLLASIELSPEVGILVKQSRLMLGMQSKGRD